MMSFRGAKRRLDIKSDKRHTLVIDDYAHHPNEIKATLEAVRGAYPERRLIVAFQPHRYSRTQDCFSLFAEALELADILILTDIYSAGEAPVEGIDAQSLLKTFKKGKYIPRKDLVAEISGLMMPFDIVVFLGAGDITHVSEALSQITPRKLKAICLFGGRSEEHEVSHISAKNVAASLDQDLFEVDFVGITKRGQWALGESAKKALFEGSQFETSPFGEALARLKECDIAFPVLHGTFGEDGTIQGLFEMIGVPYIGCGVESSAVAMNKATTKKLAAWAWDTGRGFH